MEAEQNQQIRIAIVENQLKEAYLDYSMSVIVGRALPDVRDGLKPVHRRILYSMWDMGLRANKTFVKSARVIGECFKYHPHGDAALYESLVRMVQDFSLRYPLIAGHGNFGSIDFTDAAQMRYTECKLNKFSESLITDIDKETVNFAPNFDGSLQEPVVLPAKIPNLLVNGSAGIAVGMATNIPPHNVGEVCDAVIALVDNPNVDDAVLLQLVKGPDFPTGALIVGTSSIIQAYRTGRGKVTVRAKCDIENNTIIIREIPYQVNKPALIEQIADLVRDKVVEGISDIRDESNKEGMQIPIEIKRGFDANTVLKQLYKHSQLETTFGIINLALVDGQPRVLTLREICVEFIKHRKEVVTRRTKYELRKAEERDHVLQGLLIALNVIDAVVALIKGSKDSDAARAGLITEYSLTEIQANAILEMRLSRLAALEQQKILDEHNALLKFIAEMKAILASEVRIFGIIKDELIAVKNEYADPRRTQIILGEEEDEMVEDLVKKEDVVVTLTRAGYVKRLPLELYKAQRRGGKGIIGTETKEEDIVEQVIITNTHDFLLFFTKNGTVHWLKAYQTPEATRYARGTAIANLLQLEKDDQVTATIPVRAFTGHEFLVMATKQGLVKKTPLSEFSRPRRGGIIAISLKENDRLVTVKRTDGNKQIMIATKDGRAVRFKESAISETGRTSQGVRALKVKNSEVMGMELADAPYLLTVTEKGYGKRSEINEYRLINRGGSGVINIKITEKNGNVAGIKTVNEQDEIICMTTQGKTIRIPIKDISVLGRNTQGVRIMKLDENDKAIAIARIVNEDELSGQRAEFKPSEDEAPAVPEEGEEEGENGNGMQEVQNGNDQKPEDILKPEAALPEKPVDFTLEGYDEKGPTVPKL